LTSPNCKTRLVHIVDAVRSILILDVKLSYSIKPHLYSVCIDCSMSYTLDLTSLDTLDLRLSVPEAINPVFANRLLR